MDRQGSSNRRFAMGTVAGVLVGGLLTVGALSLVPPRTANTAVPAPSKSVSSAPSSVAPTGAVSSAFPTLTQSGTPTPGGAVTPDKGTWFALVRWMSKSSFTQSQAEDYATSHSEGGQPLVVIDTDVVNLRGGKTGQWAVGVSGLSDMNAATSACRAMGLTPGGQCGRFEIF